MSYVDRVYQETGKFLSREFQDNIDAFEKKVEPKLGVAAPGRASLSMAILTQLLTAAYCHNHRVTRLFTRSRVEIL